MSAKSLWDEAVNYSGGSFSDQWLGATATTVTIPERCIRVACWAHVRRRFFEALERMANWLEEHTSRGTPRGALGPGHSVHARSVESAAEVFRGSASRSIAGLY